MTITDTELSKLTDKSSRDPEIVKLYREHSFLSAYSKHTDRRVDADPQQAIGGDWDEYGNIQRDFLIAQGLRPGHKFLDVGCGTGRLARKIVPYLDPENYTGIDISMEAIFYARGLSRKEGWSRKHPIFHAMKVDGFVDVSPCNCDFAWAFSVFIHLPSDLIELMMRGVAQCLEPAGKFYFSYVPTKLPDNTRTGLKQFKHPFSFYKKVASDLGYSLKEVAWPGRQRIAMMER